MGRGPLVGRRLDVIAERRRDRGLVARRDSQAVDERRHRRVIADIEDLGQRPHLGRQPVGMAFGRLPGRAGFGLLGPLAPGLGLGGKGQPLGLGDPGGGAVEGGRELSRGVAYGLAPAQRLAAAVDAGDLGGEAPDAVGQLLVAAGERLLAGAVGGEAGCRGIGGSLGGGKRVGCGGEPFGGGGAVLDLAGKSLAQGAGFAVEPVEALCRVTPELARPGRIVGCLGKAAGELLAAPLGLLLLALEAGTLGLEAAQRCSGDRGVLAQCRQRRLGCLVMAAGLGQGAR